MSAKKVSVSLIMPVEVREKIREIAGKLSLDSESQLYRWIIEGFIEGVESPAEVPPLTPVLEVVRKVCRKEKRG
tara:strand:- start:63 stop:284 length:222 start_codon:yes stop_codon:yes gene_type:complete